MRESVSPSRSEANSIQAGRSDRHLCLSWPTPRPCLSSAPLNGGYCQASRILNLRVNGAQTPLPPEDTLQQYADRQGWCGTTVGLMTAAPMDTLRYRTDRLCGESLQLWLTCGLDNARRAGDPADWHGELAPPAGTINTVFVTSLSLAPATMAELLMVLTEAKCAAFQDAGITSPVSGGIATGTGTDAMVIVCGSGRAVRWAGKHTLLGERAARMMMSALGDCLGASAENGFPPGTAPV